MQVPRNTTASALGLTLGLTLAWLTACAAAGEPATAGDGHLELKSPDGKIEVRINARGPLSYAIQVDGQAVLRDSRLGMVLRDIGELGSAVEVLKEDRRQVDETWHNRWGKRSEVRDHYNELHLLLRQKSPVAHSFEVVMRAFDDGVGFRYVLPTQAGLTSFVLERDATEFAFAGDFPCFSGQQDTGFKGPQEWIFKPGKLGAIQPQSVIGLPLLVQTPAAWVAVLEADLRDWSGMWLGGGPRVEGNGAMTLTAKLAPRPDGQGLVKADATHASPWRVLMVGREPGRLIESDLVLNLSTPCELADSSWVKPGKMAWDHWWSGDVQMDTTTIKEYISLAAEMGWPYQLIDWQWYGSFNQADSDITKVNPALNMDEVRQFAKDKGVKLWVWLHSNDVDRNGAYKKAFPLYAQWGVVGVKIDFMDCDNQDMVNWYEKITRAAAENHLMVNFHGAFKTSGFNRTFPNQITREGILGNEYNRWSNLVTPEHKLTLPFTRFLEGPADFTPGGFVNRQPAQFKADGKCTEVMGTRAAELALLVAFDSPLCCLCDHPAHYKNQPGSDFLKLVPTVWDDTRVLQGEVGQHLVIARRSGKDWYLGGLTNSQARSTTVKLDFLKDGHYRLHLWKDAPDSNVNAEHLETEDKPVTAADTLTVTLAPAGGFVAWLQRE